MTKLTDLIENQEKLSYSFEVTPYMSAEELYHLEMHPAFFSVTWNVGSCPNIDPLETAKFLMSKKKHVLLYLPCSMMKADNLEQLMNTFQENNICNLFLVSGEFVHPKKSDFKNTAKLIEFIREKTGNYFCIGIAGLIGCSDEKLSQLKETIDSGANFIITSPFVDVNRFKSFQRRCEDISITVPILPGIYPCKSFKQLMNFNNLSSTNVSSEQLEAIKNKDLNKPSFDVAKGLIQQLKNECQCTHFHFFNLDKLENVNEVVKELLLQ